uniref:LRAT domain-containing protein n=1 Tax=Pundamilia nyererei TaxID=303518 RepID=A0A3B4F8B2_9CICH
MTLGTKNGPAPKSRGDLIEIFRGSYQHWAVYVGDGSVVHLVFILHVFAGFNSIAVITQRGVVREENLRAVVGNDQWQINNSLDSTHNPRPADVIVKEARSWVGREITYHSIRRNCEHFATEQRYGVSASQQVDTHLMSVLSVMHAINHYFS